MTLHENDGLFLDDFGSSAVVYVVTRLIMPEACYVSVFTDKAAALRHYEKASGWSRHASIMGALQRPSPSPTNRSAT